MMKNGLIVSIILFLGYFAQAQVNPHALGIRLGGDGIVNGAELSYQHGFGEMNRLEFDLGFGSNENHKRMFLAGIYHWNWNIVDGLNWYVGPGAAVGYHTHKFSNNHINIGVGGQIGMEYDFNAMNVPILLSLDARPMWDFIGDDSGFGWGAALGVRYTW